MKPINNQSSSLPRLNHLVPDEQILALQFMTLNPIKATSWVFDEHLGEGITPDPSWPAWLQAMSKTLTQRRVDLVGLDGERAWLIELKQRGDIHAIGQLLVYESLYKIKHPTTATVHLILACHYMGFDLALALDKYGIQSFLL